MHRKNVRSKVKYAIIYHHREEHPVSVMCKIFGVSRTFKRGIGKLSYGVNNSRIFSALSK